MTEINIVAELKHINLRKEGPNDAQEPALDLKFTGKVPAELIDELIGGMEEMKGQALAAFWRDDGAPRFMGMSDIKFFRQIENATAVLDGIEVRSVKVKNFSFSPSEKGTGYLTFSVSSTEPPGRSIAVFAEALHENMKVHITVPQGDLFAGGDEDPKVAAGNLDAMAREDGGASLESGGKVLATFGDGPDPLYEQAVAIVRETGRCSISSLQRALKTGYNRSARLVERMESEGVVSTPDEKGARKVITDNALH